jgi:predicted GIY-YIG superfamily endonuclease
MTCCLYRHFDKDDALLYVGVSLNAVQRLSQHRDASHWFAEIASVKVEWFADRKEALAAERAAITAENPRHNLYRPTVKEVAKSVKEVAESGAEDSRRDLVRRLVQFNPLYVPENVATILGTTKPDVERLLDTGELGSVMIPNARYGPRRRVTGWQLIEFLEYREAENDTSSKSPGRRLHSGPVLRDDAAFPRQV